MYVVFFCTLRYFFIYTGYVQIQPWHSRRIFLGREVNVVSSGGYNVIHLAVWNKTLFNL